jgi:hypothetical protein
MAGAGGSPIDSGGDWQQVTHSHQVVGSGREGEGPTNPGDSTMTSLARPATVLNQPKISFHSFAPPLAEQVAGMARAAAVDCAVDLLRDVRCDSILTQCAHQLLLMVTLVGAERERRIFPGRRRQPLNRKRRFNSFGLRIGSDYHHGSFISRNGNPG